MRPSSSRRSARRDSSSPSAASNIWRSRTPLTSITSASITRCGQSKYWRGWRGCAGDIPRSAQLANDVISEADRRGHPVSICIALIYATTVALWSEETDLANQRIGRLLEHAGRHALTPYRVVGEGLMGQLAVQCGDTAKGVAAIERALNYCHIEGHQVLATEMMASLARGQAALGLIEAARSTAAGAIEHARVAGGACNLADLVLVQAELEIIGGSSMEMIDRLVQPCAAGRATTIGPPSGIEGRHPQSQPAQAPGHCDASCRMPRTRLP